MGEISEAVQIINVGYEGIEIAMKVGSAGIDKIKKAIELLILLLEHEKSLGKTSLKKLLEKGGDLQVFQFNSDDIKKFQKLAKKYGILYSEIPDTNKADGLTEIFFHSEAVPRLNLLMQKLNSSKISTFEEYLKNSNAADIDSLLAYLKKQKNGIVHTEDEKALKTVDSLIEKIGLFAAEKQAISVDAMKENFQITSEQAETVMKRLVTIGLVKSMENGEYKVMMDKEAFTARLQGYQELANRIRAVSESRNLNLVDITIARKMIAGETEEAVKTRIPYESSKYIWIPKDKLIEINEGKTILTFLDKEEEYSIVDASNKEIGRMKGESLYEKNYDPVSAGLSAKYNTQKKQQAKQPVNAITPEKVPVLKKTTKTPVKSR